MNQEGKNKRLKKTYHSSQSVLKPNRGFLIQNTLPYLGAQVQRKVARTFSVYQTPSVCCWNTLTMSSFSISSSAGVSALLIGCPPNQELICLIEKPCCSQYVFISLLSGIHILILNCTAVSALPLQINLILVLCLDSTHGLFIGQGECRSSFSCRFTKEVAGSTKLAHRWLSETAEEGDDSLF